MIKKKPTKKSPGKKLQIKVKDLKTKKDAKAGCCGSTPIKTCGGCSCAAG